MDIVVTIPMSRLGDIIDEEKKVAEAQARGEDIHFFWEVSRKPKKLEVGDRVYFVWHKAVRSWHEVTGFDENKVCTTTGRRYKGCCIMLDVEENEIKPIPMKGFQGYRYANYRTEAG